MNDGTDRLCQALYFKSSCPSHYLGGSEARMLYDAATEIERLRDRLRCADDVVSYLVIFGAAPTDRLAELVSRRMEQRQRDKQTLCLSPVVREAITPNTARCATPERPTCRAPVLRAGNGGSTGQEPA